MSLFCHLFMRYIFKHRCARCRLTEILSFFSREKCPLPSPSVSFKAVGLHGERGTLTCVKYFLCNTVREGAVNINPSPHHVTDEFREPGSRNYGCVTQMRQDKIGHSRRCRHTAFKLLFPNTKALNRYFYSRYYAGNFKLNWPKIHARVLAVKTTGFCREFSSQVTTFQIYYA
jgi:hypothetical protein